MPLRCRTLPAIRDIDAAAWDALAGPSNPFVQHAFLQALETSDSVGAAAGWQPMHLLVEDGDTPVAAMPLYGKHDSYGEFIFDYGWAQASLQAGIAYYPKLVAAVPYTPATGPRLLRRPGVAASAVAPTLAEGLRAVARATGASGAHVLFCSADEARALGQAGFVVRHSHQYHWLRRPHWHTFADFTADMRASCRKQVRRERERAAAHGLRIAMHPAAALSPADWRAVHAFYRNTIWEKGAQAYLSPEFFAGLREHPEGSVWVAMAHRGDVPVAAALYFRAGTSLFGRYWGAAEPLDALHFELCYYLPIAWGLQHGIERFEAGAQGEHKLRRGLMPSRCYSAHWLSHPALMDAVARFCGAEAEHVAAQLEALAPHGPFHRSEPASPAPPAPLGPPSSEA